MSKFYAGIGSRETPEEIKTMMTNISSQLEKSGWLLSSGGAQGADQAFEDGVSSIEANRIILATNGNHGKWASQGYIVFTDLSPDVQQYCKDIVFKIHPAPDKLKPFPLLLHSRNVIQIMGEDLNTWVKFVLYYAQEDKYGVPKGGTRTAVLLAKSLGIPAFNMLHDEVIQRLKRRYNV